MAFNPNSISPPSDYVDYVVNNSHRSELQSATFWARWGAAQAAEALKYQMPTDGIRDRPPTEADGDRQGRVQALSEGSWGVAHWTFIAANHAGNSTNGEDGPIKFPWLHTPRWPLTHELTPKEQALALLKGVKDQFTDQEFALLCQVVESAPVKTTPATPLTIGGHVVKPGDHLILGNNKTIIVHEVSWGDDLWQVVYRETSQSYGLNYLSVYANGVCPFEDGQDILAVVAERAYAVETL